MTSREVKPYQKSRAVLWTEKGSNLMKHYQKPLLSTSLNRPFYERNKRNMEIRKEKARSAKRYFLGGTYHNAITVMEPRLAALPWVFPKGSPREA